MVDAVVMLGLSILLSDAQLMGLETAPFATRCWWG